MRCIDCVWYRRGDRRCIRLGKRIIMPGRLRACPHYNRVPEMVANYIKRVSEVTGVDMRRVMNSEPVKNYLEKFTKSRLLWHGWENTVGKES